MLSALWIARLLTGVEIALCIVAILLSGWRLRVLIFRMRRASSTMRAYALPLLGPVGIILIASGILILVLNPETGELLPSGITSYVMLVMLLGTAAVLASLMSGHVS